MSQARTKQLKSSVQVTDRGDSYLTEGKGDREIFGLILLFVTLLYLGGWDISIPYILGYELFERKCIQSLE